jgi:hypothetical protein
MGKSVDLPKVTDTNHTNLYYEILILFSKDLEISGIS